MQIQTRYGRALAERGSSHPAAGFSLAEMMVVIVIIGLLATMVVPNVLRYLGNANSTKVEADMNQITTAISTYTCLLYTSPSPRDQRGSRMPSSA